MGLHQWKKYKVNYEKIWEAIFNKNSDKYEDFLLSTDHGDWGDDFNVYTGYSINSNGTFKLINPRKAELMTPGSIMYAIYDSDGYYKVPSYIRNEKRIEKFVVLERERASSGGEGDNYSVWYSWSERTANHEGYYNTRLKQTIAKQGSYLGLVQGQDDEYPKNDKKGDFWYVYDKKLNDPPSKPTSFTLPEKVISRSETEISWTKSNDPEGDPISYKLERSLDGGSFVERYKGSFTRYKDIIEDKGHTSVVYRVTAIDSNGNQSESLTSASLPVSDNTIPTIETTSADLGKIISSYSVDYKVVDPDEGQTWTVTESLDGKELKTFDAKVGTSYTSKLSAIDWQKVLNGKHVLKIEVVDSEGGKSFKDISFEKAINKLDFMLDKVGLQGIDKMPERAILSMSASVPSGASIKIEITNNALDDKPVWQDCTAQVLGNEKIFFSNKTKTATQWAVNVRVTGDKKTATDVLSVSVIGGFYD